MLGITSYLISAFIAVFLAFLVRYYYKNKRFYELMRLVPGPQPLPLIGNAFEFVGGSSKMIARICELLDQYDGMVPLWIGQQVMVFTSNPEDLQVFYSSSKMVDRSDQYQFIEPALGEGGLFTANGNVWKKARKLISPSFHPNVLKPFVKSFFKHSNVFLGVLSEQVGKEEFDIAPYMKRLFYDLIVENAFDFEGNALTGQSPVLTTAVKLMDIINYRMYKVWLHPDFIFNNTKIGREHRYHVGFLRNFLQDIVNNHRQKWTESREKKRETIEKRHAFIYHMLENGCDDTTELMNQIGTIAVTGFDTTAVTMSFILMLLGMHPEVQEKLYMEVVDVEESWKGRELEVEDLSKYSYMELVIKETLRVFPVGPIISRKLTEDVKFSKYTLPKGATVAAVMFKTHRDPKTYPNPLHFDPDNFLPERCEGRHPFAYVPFSSGPRNCIGSKYAMMSMKISLSRILLRYKFHCKSRIQDLRIKSEITSKVEGGFNVSVEERNKL